MDTFKDTITFVLDLGDSNRFTYTDGMARSRFMVLGSSEFLFYFEISYTRSLWTTIQIQRTLASVTIAIKIPALIVTSYTVSANAKWAGF